jgi:hypothetical protein
MRGNSSSQSGEISAGIQQVLRRRDLARPKSTDEPDVEKIPEPRTKAKRLRQLLRQVESVPGVGNVVERDRDAHRKRNSRAAAKTVVVPACEDRARRERLEADDEEWLRYCFARESGSENPFWYDFTDQQKEMITAIRNAIIHGGDQPIAASRGEGKPTYFERMLLKYTLQGMIRFAVLFAATGSPAQDSLESIKQELETNERLRADYPEVCVPILALENTPNRAHYQLVTGERHDNGQAYESASSRFSRCGQEIYLPKAPGSPSAGAIIATRGLDAAVRGVKKKGRRVDVACIDDPDTEETARSEEQAKKLEDRIDRAIAGLGSQQRRISRVMLTTLQNRTWFLSRHRSQPETELETEAVSLSREATGPRRSVAGICRPQAGRLGERDQQSARTLRGQPRSDGCRRHRRESESPHPC